MRDLDEIESETVEHVARRVDQHREHAPCPRVMPFAAYMVLMVLETPLRTWVSTGTLYAVQIGVTCALLAWYWPAYRELRRPSATPARHWVAGVLLGAAVFVAWINLDAGWMQLGDGRGVAASLSGDESRWSSIALRMFGVVVAVPLMEELFWRSFMVRWIERPAFATVLPREIGWRAMLVAALLFGAEHHLWLAGFVAGLAYTLLYRSTGSLWVVVVAHAVTNAMLEIWVARTGNWQFL